MRFDSRSFRVHAIGVALLVAIVAGACTCSPKKPVMETLKKEGEACMADDRCETGLCDGTPPVCVRKCSIGCKTEEVCTQLTPGRFSCQPDQRRLCQACQLDSDCPYPADKCIVVNSEKVCGRDCAFDQSCPTGYVCVNGRGSDGMTKVQQCSPMVASCACLARGELLQGCSISNDAGTCMGQKTCDLVNNGITCNAKTPKLEACNGQDDDCDGRIDEDGMMVSCGVGACMRTVNACADGGIALCTPGMPITELWRALHAPPRDAHVQLTHVSGLVVRPGLGELRHAPPQRLRSRDGHQRDELRALRQLVHAAELHRDVRGRYVSVPVRGRLHRPQHGPDGWL
jgi:hypothetical protein